MAQLSPGVVVNEIDLSIVVPTLGNATAAFAGVFTKGPSDKYVLITDGEKLIETFGYPTNDNYNDWFQAYNFLQYANKLLVSRAVDANGTFTDTLNTVSVVNELGKVEITNAPMAIEVGSYVKFDENSEDEYMVTAIEAPVDAVSQVGTLTVTAFVDGDYSAVIDGTTFTYSSVGAADVDTVAAGLAGVIALPGVVTDVAVGGIITLTADVEGTPFTASTVGAVDYLETVANVEGQTYELVFDATTDFATIAIAGQAIFVKDSAINAIAAATKDGGTAKTTAELKMEALYIPNEENYQIEEMSIPVTGDDKLKFFAKSSGSLMNGVEIAIAREADFDSNSEVFSGLIVNSFFETKPSEAEKEIAVLVRQDEEVTGAYIVSTIPGSKDYRNKSNYVEDIINTYDTLVYVKDNTAIVELPASALVAGTLKLANGSDGVVNVGDIEMAYGNVAENTIFGNKEDIDVDIVIANEAARVVAGKLASERADCIAFIGARFEDVVGLKSTAVIEKLILDVTTGELNNSSVANSFSAAFGNYKYQYDKFNDKFRWVSVAGDVAGLRADTNSKLNSWWASAGIDRGQIKNAQKLAFNPNLGQRDFLYKNKYNPIVSFPGLGNAIVWGQKTLQSKPSAFDRINVRGLFNTLERSISRMAKYYLFEFNDVYTRNRFVATIKPFMESVKAGRGVYDFYVRCDEGNNTAQVIDSNQFIADIAVKPTRVAEFITLNFIAVGTGVDFKEIFV